MANNEIDIFEDEIDLYLDEYIESRGLDRNKIPSSQWAAAMMYINAHTFKNGDLLRQRNTINNEPYDLDAVLALLNKYCFLCADYCQRICIDHFCLLSGITRATINYWANDMRRSNDKRAKQVYVTLMENGMMAADDLMVSKSGVNSIAYRNAVQDRYNQYLSKQDNKSVIDTDDLVAKLGIAERLALPDQQQEQELSRVRHRWQDAEIDEINI